LLFASPTINLLIKPPADQHFSDLYLLGLDHKFENYPYNIAVGEYYTLYVGVGNHLGSAAYYTIYVKLLNQTDLLPNATSGTPSSVQPSYEYKFFLEDGESWEDPLVFSVSEASINANQSIIHHLLINDFDFNINKYAIRDTNSTGFYYGLICELWVYNATINTVQFHNRAVSLRLNLT
jgi:uncharacterized membrane protein